MAPINRPTIGTDFLRVPSRLLRLLRRTVAVVAKRLQIAKPEQVEIAFVGDDVIGHLRSNDNSFLKTRFAKRMFTQLCFRSLAPAS